MQGLVAVGCLGLGFMLGCWWLRVDVRGFGYELYEHPEDLESLLQNFTNPKGKTLKPLTATMAGGFGI